MSAMATLMNHKLPNPQIVRKTVLEGHRFTPTELLDIGMVDEVVLVLSPTNISLTSPGTMGSSSSATQSDSTFVASAALTFAKSKAPLAKSGVFGLIRKEIHRSVFEAARADRRLVQPGDEMRIWKMRKEGKRHSGLARL